MQATVSATRTPKPTPEERLAFIAKHVPALHPYHTGTEWRCPSWTDSGVSYAMHDMVSGRERTITCTCPGFTHAGHCRHEDLFVILHPVEGTVRSTGKSRAWALSHLRAMDAARAKRSA